MSKISVVIPTYNEAENIEKIIHTIGKLDMGAEIVVVDDNSTDGTGDLVESLRKDFKRLKVLHRTERGLASAVVEGFQAAGGDILGVMDADFSHPPELIPELISPLVEGKTDLIVASRYVRGGEIVGWNLFRKITSKGAVLLSRPLTNLKDPVSGFFFFKKEVIKSVDFDPKGFKICLEIIVKGEYEKVLEIPYTFTNRKKGKSKLDIREYLNYLAHLSKLYLYRIKGAGWCF